MNATFHTRYVLHSNIDAYKALGWRVVSNGYGLSSHGYWTALMRFDGEATPPEPDLKIEGAPAPQT